MENYKKCFIDDRNHMDTPDYIDILQNIFNFGDAYSFLCSVRN